jgi:hypothetical protein
MKWVLKKCINQNSLSLCVCVCVCLIQTARHQLAPTNALCQSQIRHHTKHSNVLVAAISTSTAAGKGNSWKRACRGVEHLILLRRSPVSPSLRCRHYSAGSTPQATPSTYAAACKQDQQYSPQGSSYQSQISEHPLSESKLS